MEYSANTASWSWVNVLFVLPHFLIGVGCIAAAVRKKLNLPILAFGMLFAGVASYVWAEGALSTWQCHRAAVNGKGTLLRGTVSSVETRVKKNSRWVGFNIGDTTVSTATYGLNTDCGFLEPAGNTYYPKDGQFVEALLFNGRLIRLKVLSAAEQNQQKH